MDIRFQVGGQEKWNADVFLVPLQEGEKILESCPRLDDAAPFLEIAPGMRDVSGRKDEVSVVYGHPKAPLARVMFVGLGKSPVDMETLRLALARGVRKARKMRLHSVGIPLFALERFGDPEALAEEAAYAQCLAQNDNGMLKTSKRDDLLDYVAFCFDGEFVPDELRVAIRKGERAAEAVSLARELAGTPANLLWPERFAERAEELARDLPLRCTILHKDSLEAKGFGAHLAVGSGSVNPPCLVTLEYAPKGTEDQPPLVFIGKGITFDSGGISLKPAAKMHQMKSDVSGASAVLAAMVALAGEGVERRVVGVMALAENLPGGSAVRPGDVVTSLKGDSVEIVNTDAEGRLVLCDAIAYAQSEYKPAAIVDVATLTGACAVALGDQVAGLFSNDAGLAEKLMEAGSAAGEPYWQLPLWQGYGKKLKSLVADICHTASSREGGAITAALFLEHFVEKATAWAHLDIAGVDWIEHSTPLCPAGTTGFSARTLLELARKGV